MYVQLFRLMAIVGKFRVH